MLGSFRTGMIRLGQVMSDYVRLIQVISGCVIILLLEVN
jgi:hypothetical protein